MKEHKPKIGLIPVTLKMFWGLYPELEGKTRNVLEQVIRQLEKHVDVRCPELIGNKQEAHEAAEYLKKESPDLLVVWGSGYVSSDIPDTVIRHLEGIPILLLSTQLDTSVPPGMDYVRYWENSSFTAMVELGGALSKSGILFRTIVGQHEEQDVYRKVAAIAETATLKSNLKSLNIGVVGQAYPGMLDIVLDERCLNELGPTVTHISLAEIEKRYKAMPDNRVEDFLESSRGDYDAGNVGKDDLFRAARLYCVLEDIVKDFHVNAFCLHDYECISFATKTLSEFALSMIANRMGIPSGCEGDLPNTVGAFIIEAITGQSSMFVDWAMFDESRNAIYFVHNGKADPAIVTNPVLKPTAEPFGIIGDGVVFEVMGKPGPVTMASMIYDKNGWKFFASQGVALQADSEPCRQNQMTVEVDRPVREYLESVCNLGITHHVNIVHGHIAENIRQLAQLLDIEFVEP